MSRDRVCVCPEPVVDEALIPTLFDDAAFPPGVPFRRCCLLCGLPRALVEHTT